MRDAEGLSAALSSSKGGVILLAGGNWGRVTIRDVKPPAAVVIRAADPKRRPVIEYLSVLNSQGLTFSSLEVQVSPGRVGAFIRGSSNIRFESMDFHGLVDGDVTNEGSGIAMRDSPSVTITRCEFYELRGGVSHINSDGLTVTDNKMHDLMSDGVLGTGSDNVVVSRNDFRDFRPSGGVHPDAIQFWTAKDAPTKNIIVSDNTFVRGNGAVVQGIFMANEGGTGYQNVKITGNAIVGSMFHGINLVGAADSVVSDNLVAGYKDMVARITIKRSVRTALLNNRATAFVQSEDVDLRAEGNKTIRQAPKGDTAVLERWRRDRAAAGRSGGGNDY